MTAKKLATVVGAGLLLAGASWTAANAQVPRPGVVYSLHSPASSTCPSLDWHLVTGDNGSISGMVAWNDMKSMAKVTGTVGADRKFNLTATEVGGAGTTATITGQAESNGWLLADINGPGVACKSIKVPIWRRSGGMQH